MRTLRTLKGALFVALVCAACSSQDEPPEPEGELIAVPPRHDDDDPDDGGAEDDPLDDGGPEDASQSADGDADSGDDKEPNPDETPTVGPACGAAPYRRTQACPDAIGEQFCSEGAAHQPQGSAIAWQHNPPHSGPHYPAAAGYAVFDEPAPRGAWVHSLEHGAVVLLYNCESSCAQDLELLHRVIAERPEARIVLTPDPELEPTRFAAVSWTWVYATDELDLETLLCFVDQHEGNAPESIF